MLNMSYLWIQKNLVRIDFYMEYKQSKRSMTEQTFLTNLFITIYFRFYYYYGVYRNLCYARLTSDIRSKGTEKKSKVE